MGELEAFCVSCFDARKMRNVCHFGFVCLVFALVTCDEEKKNVRVFFPFLSLCRSFRSHRFASRLKKNIELALYARAVTHKRNWCSPFFTDIDVDLYEPHYSIDQNREQKRNEQK